MRRRCYKLYLRSHSLIEVLKSKLSRYVGNESGAGTVEYALLIAVIVIGIIAAASVMFDPLKEFFIGIIDKIKSTAGI